MRGGGLVLDASGNLFASARDSHKVFKYTPSGAISVIIDGSGDGMGNTLVRALDTAVDAAGNVIEPEGVFGVANPIQAVLDALDISVCVPKSKIEKLEIKEKPEIKEFKNEKLEIKEKPEIKEFKDEKREIKELKEFKEPKDFLEPKDIKEPKGILEPKGIQEPKGILEPKDIREPKGILEPKDIQEPKNIAEPKGISEPKFFEGGRPFGAGPLDERLGRLEAAVTQLTHFISRDLRPDLSGGALKGEPDLGSASQATSSSKLQNEANQAKHSKDNKDTEKSGER